MRRCRAAWAGGPQVGLPPGAVDAGAAGGGGADGRRTAVVRAARRPRRGVAVGRDRGLAAGTGRGRRERRPGGAAGDRPAHPAAGRDPRRHQGVGTRRFRGTAHRQGPCRSGAVRQVGAEAGEGDREVRCPTAGEIRAAMDRCPVASRRSPSGSCRPTGSWNSSGCGRTCSTW